jgi:hypothetical protein
MGNLNHNVALRALIAAAYAGAFDGGTAQVRAGTRPASSDNVATGTLLVPVSLPTPALAATNQNVAKAGVWSGIASAAGDAGYIRLISATGDRRIDIEVGAGATVSPSVAIAAGMLVEITLVAFSVPAS